MDWWVWLLAGFVLLALELFTPGGLYLLFLGLSAMIVGALLAAGVPLSPAMQWVVAAVCALLLLVGLRKYAVGRFFSGGRDVSDELTGKEVLARENIAPGQFGRGEFRGSDWKLMNCGNTVITQGDRVTVEKSDGLTLHVHRN